jgi:hypothetical protein
VLGWLLGDGSTALDDWFRGFRHTPARWLSVFADARTNAVVLAVVVAVALYRRWWRTAVVALVFPIAAYVVVQLIKPWIGRHKGSGLAYPSGHETVTVVVWGLVVVVAGFALWAVVAGIAASVLGMVGLGVTYHYFTDTVGSVLLGTSIVCIAALIAKPDLTRVNPTAIYVTGGR